MTLEDFHIESFEVPHDGTDNVGYCIEIDGKVFSFLTDLRGNHSDGGRLYQQGKLSDSGSEL